MTKRMMAAVVLGVMLSPWASLAQPAKLPMPPNFTSGASVEQTLHAYPLGVVTRQAAFSHHGTAHREIKLPNGLEGWVYDVGGVPKDVSYIGPKGKRQTVREAPVSHEARSYTLVFDNRGVVVDVLYNESGPHDGLTALSLQHRKGVLRMEEHVHPGPRQ